MRCRRLHFAAGAIVAAETFREAALVAVPEVVQHYNGCLNLGLSGGQQNGLVDYLRSL